MKEPDFKPEIIGRDEELKELKGYLDKAAEGKGNTLFLSGEAGIGKTRLVDELKNTAQSKGFQVLSGHSLHESLIPYMPFLEALRSGGKEYLFSEEAPRVEAVYLISDTSILIKEVLREQTELNPDLFASMLMTVADFVKESLSMLSGEEKEGTLNSLGYENYRILIESGANTNLVVIITGRENEFLIDEMREMIRNVDQQFGHVLRKWAGDEKSVSGIEDILLQLITSGRYDGIYYGRDDPRSRRNLLFENVSLGLIRQTQTTPTLLCIEDLQWADPSSLTLMHYIARNTKNSSLLILGTYRPEDVAAKEDRIHPLVDTMRLMSRDDILNKMELRRLKEVSASEFITAMLGETDFSDEFKNQIYKETEGNPLFILELVKLMVEEEIICRDNGTWKLAKDIKEVIIPSKIYDVIARRLDRLEEKHREVLDYASVIGDEFESTLISTAFDIPKAKLLKAFRVLEQKHKLIHSYNGNYMFDHAKIREVLYSELPGELRMEYHAMIGDAIENQNLDNLEAVAEDLGFHYYHCRNAQKGVPYLLKSAEKAKKEYANKEVIRFYSEALELADDKQKRLEILKQLGDIFDLIGEYERGIESYREAVSLTDYVRIKSELLAKIGKLYEKQGEYDKAISHCAKALENVEGDVCKEGALALMNIGIVHWSKGNYDKALKFHKDSLEINEKLGDQPGIANSLKNISTAYWSKGEYDKALEFHKKSFVIFEKLGDQRGMADALNTMGNVNYDRGKYDTALKYYHKTLEIVRRIGDKRGIAYAINNIGYIYHCRGDYEKALENLTKSSEIFKKIGDQRDIAGSLDNIGSVHSDRGEYDRALEYYEKGLEMRMNIGDQRGTAASFHNIGALYCDNAEYDKALEYYLKGMEIFEKIGHQYGLTHSYCGLALIYLKKKDLALAAELSKKTLKLSEEIGVKENIARSKQILAVIYREREEWKDSIENFEESIKIQTEMATDKELADTYYEFGLMWKAKGDIGNADEYLNKALEIFKKLKLNNKEDEVKEVLESLRARNNKDVLEAA